MNLAKYLVVPLALAITVGCAQSLLAQGTDLGTIRGTVTDPSGAVIANASVTIADLATNTLRHTETNPNGEYQLFGLPSGTYKVAITAPGMTAHDITGVVISGSDTVNANAVLKVSTASETVVVTSEASTINTADQTISDTINSREVIDLPRDSRDVYQFLYLNPNITQGTDAGEFKFLGFQSYGANFALDGQRSNNAIFGSPTNSEPSLEAVGEVNVLSISALSMREFPIFALLPSVVDRSFTARRFTTTKIPPWRRGRYKTCKARETLFRISL